MYDPVHSYYTGFSFKPESINTFDFGIVLDVGVRVFLVSPGDPISLQPILSGSYTELGSQPSYVFNKGVPFVVGLYTGNLQFHPPDGIYSDPLFGWVVLENVNGTIQLLNSALEYQGGGIIAGTQTILPVPEPGTWGLLLCGAVLLGFGRWYRKPLEFHKMIKLFTR